MTTLKDPAKCPPRDRSHWLLPWPAPAMLVKSFNLQKMGCSVYFLGEVAIG
jgi:hypothetical protein